VIESDHVAVAADAGLALCVITAPTVPSIVAAAIRHATTRRE
jgi:hypothetical protein